ncbi:hypothetical protein CRUP_009503 [Coryphaenoides rupestris]|nr:hypothetical protein CRUP_009503 [Coryphaenoides rupestris]
MAENGVVDSDDENIFNGKLLAVVQDQCVEIRRREYVQGRGLRDHSMEGPTQKKRAYFRIPSFRFFSRQGDEKDGVFCMSLSPEGAVLAVIHFSGRLSLWEPGFEEINPEWKTSLEKRKKIKGSVGGLRPLPPGGPARDLPSRLRSVRADDTVSEPEQRARISTSSLHQLTSTRGARCVLAQKRGVLESSTVLWRARAWAAAPAAEWDISEEGCGARLEAAAGARRSGITDSETILLRPLRLGAGVCYDFRLRQAKGLYSYADGRWSGRVRPAQPRPRPCWKEIRTTRLVHSCAQHLPRSLYQEEGGFILPGDVDLDDLPYEDFLSAEEEAAMKKEREERKRQELLAKVDFSRFILPGDVDLDDLPYEDFLSAEEEAAMKKEREERKRQELLAKVDFSRLTLEQKELCRSRLKLLTYLDRLATYERFRSQNIIASARTYARESNVQALDILFTFHGSELLKHRLAVLNSFPETTSPHEYTTLLPEACLDEDGGGLALIPWEEQRHSDMDWCEEEECSLDEDGGGLALIPWEEQRHSDMDWCEEEECRAMLDLNLCDDDSLLYEEAPALLRFRSATPPIAMLTDWYLSRAQDIDSRSRQGSVTIAAVLSGDEEGPGRLSRARWASDASAAAVVDMSRVAELQRNNVFSGAAGGCCICPGRAMLDLNLCDDDSLLYEEAPALLRFRSATPPIAMLTDWYLSRAQDIDSRSRQGSVTIAAVLSGNEEGPGRLSRARWAADASAAAVDMSRVAELQRNNDNEGMVPFIIHERGEGEDCLSLPGSPSLEQQLLGEEVASLKEAEAFGKESSEQIMLRKVFQEEKQEIAMRLDFLLEVANMAEKRKAFHAEKDRFKQEVVAFEEEHSQQNMGRKAFTQEKIKIAKDPRLEETDMAEQRKAFEKEHSQLIMDRKAFTQEKDLIGNERQDFILEVADMAEERKAFGAVMNGFRQEAKAFRKERSQQRTRPHNEASSRMSRRVDLKKVCTVDPVDCALALVRLGKERQIPGLEPLCDDLVTMETLVYETSCELSLTLRDLQQLGSIHKLRLLMKNCQQKIVRDPDQLMTVALESIYSCERDDQLNLCYDILECLPQRGYGVV